jgi:hypothetical protein
MGRHSRNRLYSPAATVYVLDGPFTTGTVFKEPTQQANHGGNTIAEAVLMEVSHQRIWQIVLSSIGLYVLYAVRKDGGG